jgi:integrase/recombinase XerD
MEMEIIMLTQLFPKSHRSYTNSPVASLLEGFADWLTGEGYANTTTRAFLLHLKRALDRARSCNANQKFLVTDLNEYFAPWAASAQYRSTKHVFQRFLLAREQLILEPDNRSFASLLCAYEEHLRDVRGSARATVKNHLMTVSAFLSISLSKDVALDALTPVAVEAFLASMAKRVTRQSMELAVSHLRTFFRFCHDRGEIVRRLDLIDRPCTYRGELQPRALNWDLVSRLLSSIDRTGSMGCRDYTILYLLAHYGMRPSEAATLVMESIDWKARSLRLEQNKTHSTLVLPLSDEALQVLTDYLHAGRANSQRKELFLCAKAPVHALTNHAIARIYKVRCRQSGLPLSDSSVYALRHSFAMLLLERGVAVKTIGDLLGHRTLQSTCTYLRLQVEALREVALPLPANKDFGGCDETF